MKLEGVKSNRSAIGARVLVHYGGKTQAQSVLSQSSYYSCNDPRLHFGLGQYTPPPILRCTGRAVWWNLSNACAVNRLITLREGVGQIPNRGWSKS